MIDERWRGMKNCKNCKIYPCKMNGIVSDKGCIYYLPQTNADKIRSMSDEELAIKNVVYLHDADEPYYIVSDGTIFGLSDCEIDKMSDEEVYRIALKHELNWLKSEVSDEN